MRGFPEAEFVQRCERAQALMAKHNLAALLLTTEPEVRYFTGYLTRFWESPTRPWFLIVPAKGKPVAVIPSIGAALMGQTWIEDIRTWVAPDLIDDGIGLLGETLREVAGAKGVIGIPDGHESHVRMPLKDLDALRSELGAERFSGDQGILAELRMIKSDAEVAKIEEACAIAGRAFARAPSIARKGNGLDEVYRRFQMLCLEEGADWVPYLAGGAGKDGYGDVISPATQEPLRAGDVLMLDTGVVWDGYFCDFDRNWALGPPSAAVRDAHARLVEAVDATADIARPGKTASELFEVMNRSLGGGTDAGRLGHGLGMSLTEWPSLIATDHTVLESGMVLTLEPGLNIGSKVMVHEENVLITEGTPRFLSPRIGPEIPVL
ncbi:MAG: Xaa-Pro peptidase family protein [Pseudomonadota bacterium]